MSKPKAKPQYQQIIDDFLTQLQDGRLAPGDRIPTENALMERFKVSRITVTRAMKELEHRGFIYRLKKRGSFIADRSGWFNGAPAAEAGTNAPAAAAVPIIAVVAPFEVGPEFKMLRGVEQACRERGLYASFHNTLFDPVKEREIVRKLMRDNVRGIIAYPISSERNIQAFSELAIRRFPFVLVDRSIDGLDAPLVAPDNAGGMFAAVSHLIGLGHRRIAFVSPAFHEAESIPQRYKGYCRALIAAGISIRQEWVVDDFGWSASTRPEAVLRSVTDVLDRLMALDDKPTALACLNDYTALYVMKAALQAGLSVPDDLSVTGFDNLEISAFAEIPLTTVEQPFYAIGERAAGLLLDRSVSTDDGAGRSENVILDTKLIVRQSTAAPRG